MPNHPSDDTEKNRPESKAERAEQRAAKSILRQEAPEERQALVDRQVEVAEKDKSVRALTPEAAATLAKRGEKVVGAATLALGFSPSLEKTKKDGSKSVILPGRTADDVQTLSKAEATGANGHFPFDPNELQGKAKESESSSNIAEASNKADGVSELQSRFSDPAENNGDESNDLLAQNISTEFEFSGDSLNRPADAKAWREELRNFSESLEKQLRRAPEQADFAAIMLQSSATNQEALDATIMYAYGIRNRGRRDLGEFAETAALEMIERGKRWQLFPEDPQQIDAEMIQQNYPDSCPFIATIIGLAKSEEGKKALAAMIKPNTDGTYEVFFPGDITNPVTVGGLTPGEKMLGASSEQGYIFPAILEKAYGIRLNAQQDPSKRLPINSDASRLNFFDNYTEPLKLLTGDEVKTVATRRFLNPEMILGEDKLRDALEKSKAEGTIVLAGIKAPPADKELRDMGIHENHAYLVTGFDEDGVQLRDSLPGDNRNKKVKWKQFNDNFNDLLIQEKSEK